ncbi:MAG: DUF255 domain-containing protein [Acidithiobacillus sp.]|nr:DUF255 domain-containing protein [Acidithiobacillus sp.]
MNEHFVSIKADREERPDLDSIYMQATTAMTGSGDWPMSVFLMPDLRPFYAGSYFSPVKRCNMPCRKSHIQNERNSPCLLNCSFSSPSRRVSSAR